MVGVGWGRGRVTRLTCPYRKCHMGIMGWDYIPSSISGDSRSDNPARKLSVK